MLHRAVTVLLEIHHAEPWSAGTVVAGLLLAGAVVTVVVAWVLRVASRR
ncbi:MAG: hypothetical protein KQH83_11890 [Actinobacteria bacterium]|nr:hypothetical protein [Actinomycetota bacterium]